MPLAQLNIDVSRAQGEAMRIHVHIVGSFINEGGSSMSVVRQWCVICQRALRSKMGKRDAGCRRPPDHTVPRCEQGVRGIGPCGGGEQRRRLLAVVESLETRHTCLAADGSSHHRKGARGSHSR